MEDQLITSETAKLAKEKGFDEISQFSFFRGTKDYIKKEKCTNSSLSSFTYALCTQSLLQKWLRKKYSIHIEIIWIDTLRDMYVYKLLSPNNAIRPESIFYYSYEEALESGLFSALQLIT